MEGLLQKEPLFYVNVYSGVKKNTVIFHLRLDLVRENLFDIQPVRSIS